MDYLYSQLPTETKTHREWKWTMMHLVEGNSWKRKKMKWQIHFIWVMLTECVYRVCNIHSLLKAWCKLLSPVNMSKYAFSKEHLQEKNIQVQKGLLQTFHLSKKCFSCWDRLMFWTWPDRIYSCCHQKLMTFSTDTDYCFTGHLEVHNTAAKK